MLTKQKALLGRSARAESRRVREPRRTALRGARSLRVYDDGGFRVVSGQSSSSAHIWSGSGPSWWRAHLSAKMESGARVSGRLAGPIVSSLLLSAPPGFSRLVLSGGAAFFWGRSVVRQLTQVVSVLWPRQAVSVSGSPTGRRNEFHFWPHKPHQPGQIPGDSAVHERRTGTYFTY